MFRDFKPALLFLGKFLGIYLAGNILYGIYIKSYGRKADDITRLVTDQSSALLRYFGYENTAQLNPNGPTVFMESNDSAIISIFEGCNGVNVMIVFVAFIFAFKGKQKALVYFLPLGLLVIHFFNLLRISLLYLTALTNDRYFYYFHKYIFTAFLYMVVFGLWAIWVFLINGEKEKSAKA